MSCVNDSKLRLIFRLLMVFFVAPAGQAAAQASPAPEPPVQQTPTETPTQSQTPAEPAPPVTAVLDEPAASVEPSATEPAEVTPAADSAANELGAVIVTARRREENVQEVPVAVNVLNGDALEKKGPINLASFTKETASVTAFSSNQRNTTISIRGLGTLTNAGSDGVDSGVGFYVDDVFFGRVSQSLLNLVDLERVEVLRGPQGTLFGRNTTAGAISIVTKNPSFEPEAGVDVSVGNYNLLQARGSLSGAIIPGKLAGRLSFGGLTRDGWLYNREQLSRSNDLQSFAVRGQLLFTPTDKLKFRLIVDYTKQASSCCQNSVIGYIPRYANGTPLSYPYAARAAQLNYTPVTPDPESLTINSDRQRSFRVGTGGVSLRADWDVIPEQALLTSISAFRFWNTSPRNDGDGSPLDITVEGNGDDRYWQVSEELRLSSVGKKAIEYVGGLYFFYQNNHVHSRTEFGQDAGLWYIAPDAMGLTPAQRRDALNGAFVWRPANYDGLNAAAFGQATWHVLPELVDLTGGLRYTTNVKQVATRAFRGASSPIPRC